MSFLRKNKGFTLIELVIVLAIAALILAAILLAVGGAQKGQRDSQRKGDAGRILAAAEAQAGNSAGVFPADGVGPSATYFSGTDPNGSAYTFSTAAASATGNVQYRASADCTGNTPTVNASLGARVVAVGIYQEQGGVYCVTNK
jgi:prepilin-type N-terminal cleavage/methylation domain-containing protein